MTIPPELAAALEERAGRLRGFASQLAYFETAGSTNDLAASMAQGGAPHGTVVAAAGQSQGRGRMGRSWFSPPGSGLYVSLVLRPEFLSPRSAASAPDTLALASSITLTAGVALAEGVRSATGLKAEIKWPNDLVVDQRKFCGILAEGSATADAIDYVILGFGINVRTAEFPPELLSTATSLEIELGRWVDEHALLAECLARLAERLRSLPLGGFDAILERLREMSPSSLNARVEVRSPGGGWSKARTAGIDRDGALLAWVDGNVQRFIAGEVRWS